MASCYDAPKPDCGFRCGPAAACPTDYTCASDGRCHLNGTPQTLVCATPDAAPPTDAYSPAVVSTLPANGDTINPADPIRARFDVDVAGVSPASFLVSVTASSLFVVGDVTYDPVSHVAQFYRSEGLPPNAQLTVTLTGDIFDPLSGRPLMPTSYTFFTQADTTPPTVVMTTPATASTNVSVATNITYRFSEPVQNVTTGTVTLVESASATPVTGTVSYDAATRTATFDPQDQLTPNLSYTGLINGGVIDASSNSISPNPFQMTFMTGADTVGPRMRVSSPADGDTNVPVTSNIVVTFDEPVAGVSTTSFQVNAGAVAGTITMSNGNRTATFDPTADLPAAATVNVTLLNAIVDTSGNGLGAFGFSFTTQ